MKKILFAFTAILCCLSINAQVMNVMKGDKRVATYYANQADKVVFEQESDNACELLELELNNSIVADIYPGSLAIIMRVSASTDRENMVVTKLHVSKGAQSSIKEGDHLDLSADKVLTVTNGSLTKKWLLRVQTEDASLHGFWIQGPRDSYPALIDEGNKEVTLALNPNSGVNLQSAIFYVSISSTATCSPASGSTLDFTEPVRLTITDGSATSEYTVKVTMAAVPEILVVGVPSDMNALNDEERAAVKWITTNMDNAAYASWSDLIYNRIPLEKVKLVVWHRHAPSYYKYSDFRDDNTLAMNALTTMKSLYAKGVGFVLSRSAVNYAAALGAMPQDACPNNVWGGAAGEGSDMMGDDPWHFFPTDASHPLWANLKKGPDANAIYTLDPGYTICNTTSQYGFWDAYAGGIPAVEAKTGGRALISDGFSNCSAWELKSAKGEFGKGGIICIGIGLYDWNSPTPYTSNLHDNMGQIMLNALGYVGKGENDPGETGYIQPTEEDASQTFFKPETGTVGDPMPFYDKQAGDFKVMYLQEYEQNDWSRYHPFWAVSTQDGASYQPLGEWLSVGDFPSQQDAALGTGCCYYNDADGLYYIYYTGVSNQTENREVVMRATSPDLKTWTRDNQWSLKGKNFGLSSLDFRDPQIFKDGEIYHMIIATRKGDPKFADFISTDMKNWEFKNEFNAVWDRMCECPDVFKMGNWWYFIYSEGYQTVWSRKVKYMMADSFEGLKECFRNPGANWPQDNKEGVLDTRAFYAGKTASNGTDRYIWGWCPYRSGADIHEKNINIGEREPNWSGALVCHKLIQHEDGTLSVGPAPAMAAKYNQPAEVKMMKQEADYTLYNRLGYHNHISFTVKTASKDDVFGVSFVRATDSQKHYSLVIDPEWDDHSQRKVKFMQEGKEGKGFIDGTDGYLFPHPDDNTYNIDIYTDNSVVVMYINGVYGTTQRIYGIQQNCWSINNYGGKIEVSNVKVSQY